jgi:hypothetical protein
MLADLQWPPGKEELEQLYLGQRLSAAKIAKLCGLKHPNPKSSETLVLYHLKKFGIQRRDKAEHNRKVIEAMVDPWARMYESGESLKRIAGNEVSPVTVWKHLKERGVVLRDKVEAQIAAVSKYERRPFSGNRLEKAYMTGLRYGDLHAVLHGRAVRVRVSTTHPAMANLFEGLFSPYGHVFRYPRTAKLVGYEWTLECDLDDTFEFLLSKPSIAQLERLPREEMVAFLAGLFDAEGSVFLHTKHGRLNPEVAFTNTSENLLTYVASCLRKMRLNPKLTVSYQATERRGVSGRSRIGRLILWRFLEAQNLLRALPLRHEEKVEKSRLALALKYRGSPSENKRVGETWKSLSSRLKEDRDMFVELARRLVEPRRERNNHA